MQSTNVKYEMQSIKGQHSACARMQRGTGYWSLTLAGVWLVAGWPLHGQLSATASAASPSASAALPVASAASPAAPLWTRQRQTQAYTARMEAPVDTTITIHTSGTNLEFLPSRIAAKQGTRVTVRYVNEGTLPHNFVVVKAEENISTLGRAAFKAQDTDYVPLEHESLMIAHSELAAPGETVEVTFEMPPAGEYFFVCLYSGHYNMMVGTLRSLK